MSDEYKERDMSYDDTPELDDGYAWEDGIQVLQPAPSAFSEVHATRGDRAQEIDEADPDGPEDYDEDE
jgi:hypothetical protein